MASNDSSNPKYDDNKNHSKNEIESAPLVKNSAKQQTEIGFSSFLKQPQMILPFVDLFTLRHG